MSNRDLPIIGESPPPAPRCRYCGEPLRPIFHTEHRTVETVKYSDMPGYQQCRPDDTGLIAKGYDPSGFDAERGQFRHISRHMEEVGKRWAGYFGYDHNDLFCTLRCGYYFGVHAVKEQNR